MFVFPEDRPSKFLIETTWFNAYPLREFREANNDFNVLKTVRRTIGLFSTPQKSFGVIHAHQAQDYSRYIQGKALRCEGVFQ